MSVTITTLPMPPNRSMLPAVFVPTADAFLAALPQFVIDCNNFGNFLLSTVSNIGGAISIPYNFNTSTSNTDPGAGFISFDNAVQSSTLTIRIDTTDNVGTSWASVIDTFDASSSLVKGQIKIQKLTDATKWIAFNITARASLTNYRNLTVTLLGSSSANPFINGDSLVLSFARTGDVGLTGPTGNAYAGINTISSSNVTLTNSSLLSQSYGFTGLGFSIKLPVATTLSVGRNTYLFTNTGIYDYGIRDNSSNLICVVPAGSTVGVHLQLNSSAAGLWDFDNNAYPFLKKANLASTGTDATIVATLSATEFILFSLSLGALAYLNTATSTSLSWVTFSGGTSVVTQQFVVKSATSVIMATAPVTPTTLSIWGIQISSGVLTIGSASTVTINGSVGIYLASCTSGAVVTYQTSAVNLMSSVITISGTTITNNTAVTVGVASAISSFQALVVTANSQWAFAFNTVSSTNAVAICLTVSGTTPSWGTGLLMTSGSNTAISFISYTSGKYLVTWQNVQRTLSLSGTTFAVLNTGINSFTVPAAGPLVLGTSTIFDGTNGITVISDVPTAITGITAFLLSSSFPTSSTTFIALDAGSSFWRSYSLSGSVSSNTVVIQTNSNVPIVRLTGSSKLVIGREIYSSNPLHAETCIYDANIGVPSSVDATNTFVPANYFHTQTNGSTVPTKLTSKVNFLASQCATYIGTNTHALQAGGFSGVAPLDNTQYAVGIKANSGTSWSITGFNVGAVYLLEVIQ